MATVFFNTLVRFDHPGQYAPAFRFRSPIGVPIGGAI